MGKGWHLQSGMYVLFCFLCLLFHLLYEQIDEELNFLDNLGLFLQDLDNKILNNAIKGKFLNKKYYSFTVTSQGD